MISNLERTQNTRQSGYTLVAAVAIVMVLLATGLAFMRWATDESFQAHQLSGAMQAYYLAQMGVVEEGFKWVKNKQASDLPTQRQVLLQYPGKKIAGLGSIEEVVVQYLDQQSGGQSIFGQQKIYRITAVGRVDVRTGSGNESVRQVRRRAVLFVSLRNFVDYMYLTNCELTPFHEVIKFQSGDTLQGRVHSNSQISIMGEPVFYDVVSSTADDFDHQTGYNPHFLGPPPVFNAPPVLIPNLATNLREHASINIVPTSGITIRCKFVQGSFIAYSWPTGTPFDSTHSTSYPYGSQTCVFVDAPLEIYGTVAGQVTIGSSHEIRILDDIRYADADQYGRVSATSVNYLGIISEQNVKVANTVKNGRENSAGQGRAQTNQALTSVMITAAIVALGESFTFENQNDADSGYDFGSLDERGRIILYGSVTQMRRGYVHRSIHGGTGYLKQYQYDTRFLHKRPPCFFDAVDAQGRGLFDVVQWGEGKDNQVEINQSRGAQLRFN
jgi:type II secretory pathway pseudopilin PulG